MIRPPYNPNDPSLAWHKGYPPPFTGWWNASRSHSEAMWRWYDASLRLWSEYALDRMTATQAAVMAMQPDSDNPQVPVQWRWYWPEGARCLRVDPRKPPKA